MYIGLAVGGWTAQPLTRYPTAIGGLYVYRCTSHLHPLCSWRWQCSNSFDV